MTYVLDTNAVSALMKGNDTVVERLTSHVPLEHMARVPGLKVEDWTQ